MQRAPSTTPANARHNTLKDNTSNFELPSLPPSTQAYASKPRVAKLILAVLTAGLLSLTGCQTIKGVFEKDENAVSSASKSDAEYYQDAIEALDENKYFYASEQLAELRTFYPTGPYAEQALLDLMYSQFNSKEYELAAASAEQFIKLYPRNIQVDYAYYVRGVANMQANSSALLNLARLKQAHRDTSYLRLAFSNFQDLIMRYPNSAYAPDAAQRMRYIYNEFAESELAAARWYIKRDAYVAAANRAKWVFQYYPLSEQIPEAIAILAYSNEQLGLNDLAQHYKTLLQINYPDLLTNSGKVKLNANRQGSILNKITFGQLGRADNRQESGSMDSSAYNGATKTQVIQRAAQLTLPDSSTVSQESLPSLPNLRQRNFRLGLDLPEEDSQQLSNPTNRDQTGNIVSPNVMYPDASSPTSNVESLTSAPTTPLPTPSSESE